MLQCIFLLSDSGEVMVEKQMTAHRVDRAICGWFWDYVVTHAAGNASKAVSVAAGVGEEVEAIAVTGAISVEDEPKPLRHAGGGNCRVNVMVGIRDDPGKPIDSITVQFQLPLLIVSADLTSNYSTVDILADKTCLWTIGQIPKDKSPLLFGNLRLEEGLAHLHTLPTFQVKFKIMGVALSGLQIDKLEVKNTLSAPCKGFRAQTPAGKYDVRS